MFVVTEADEAAIRAVYEQRGEFAAAIELRQRALPTTCRHGSAPAPSPVGSHCRCEWWSGCPRRRGYDGCS